jgi:hypothetical protein
MRRAGYLAELGWLALESAPQAKLGEIEPIYVKQPSIRTSFDQPFAPVPEGDIALGLPRRS